MNIESFLSQLCEHCGLSPEDIKVEVEENEEEILVNLTLPESESGLFIGYHGETLDAVQRVLRLAFQRESEDKRVRLNINKYREQRQEKLSEITVSMAAKAIESGEPQTLDFYLPSHERFLVHSAISDDPKFSDKLESVSSGQGNQRRITIKLKAQ
jgi:spoIIIJ-associated protein